MRNNPCKKSNGGDTPKRGGGEEAPSDQDQDYFAVVYYCPLTGVPQAYNTPQLNL